MNWSLPGGKVGDEEKYKDESLLEGLRREIDEESGKALLGYFNESSKNNKLLYFNYHMQTHTENKFTLPYNNKEYKKFNYGPDWISSMFAFHVPANAANYFNPKLKNETLGQQIFLIDDIIKNNSNNFNGMVQNALLQLLFSQNLKNTIYMKKTK